MVKRSLRKFLYMLLTLLVVSFCVFAAFEIIPGDAAVSRLGSNATEASIAALREEMGLNRPFLVRYFYWLLGCLRLDFGTSYSYGVPVSGMILNKLPITIVLTIMSMVIVIAVSIPLGVFLAKHAHKAPDRIGYAFNQVVMAIPSFFLGILLTYLFGLVFHLVKPGGYVSYETNFWGFLGYLVMPAVSIAIPKCAMSVNYLRSSIMTEAGKDYVRTAYSRGNSTMNVTYSHVLRNALIPLITFWGMTITDMIAGGIVVEQVFGIPGLGRILLTSIANRDYPVVEAVILLIAVIVLLCNYLADFLYNLLDPRL